MKFLAYRMNRPTFAVYLLLTVLAFVIMANVMRRPPGAEVVVALLLVPRLHDLGRSGWWAVLLIILELPVLIVGLQMGGTDEILIAAGSYVILVLIGMIVIAFIPGQSRRNRWGEPLPPGLHFKRPVRSDLPRVSRRL